MRLAYKLASDLNRRVRLCKKWVNVLVSLKRSGVFQGNAKQFLHLESHGAFDVDSGIFSLGSNSRLVELMRLGVFRGAGEFLVLQPSVKGGCLAELFDKYGSDKGGTQNQKSTSAKPPHSYSFVYESLFSSIRPHVRDVLEIGIGYPGNATLWPAGNSLRVWRDYFVNAKIYGGDINPEALVSEERIETGVVDQLSTSSIDAFLNNLSQNQFDIVIDDGLHTFDANRITFEGIIHCLRPQGYYIIEDCAIETVEEFQKYFRNRPFIVDYWSGFCPDWYRLKDNTLIVIRRDTCFEE